VPGKAPLAKAGAAKIYAIKNVLHVESGENISNVKLFSVQGAEILSDSGIDNNLYTKQLGFPTGIYIVKVKLVTGEIKTEKVFVK